MIEPLPTLERRALGVLVEKALTAAAPEPLTLNAVVLGCNQKSNRDPVMDVEEPEVDDALERLQRKGLVFRITGGRAERWRHNCYDAWKVAKPELALIGELLLRGPQTAAEARARASRMEPLDQETATSAIKRLVEHGFIVWLAPENRRGANLTHGFYTADELARLKGSHASSGEQEVVSQRPAATHAMTPAVNPLVDRVSACEARVSEAVGEIGKLRDELRQLRETLTALQDALGIARSP
ncbi:MAG TPA: DUF480 domain-containing protein [Gemmataceae bacterium]|jgi:hypothetical protein|nr:DUF480 domain-containing protein [Gemmataceae bacterium]